MSKSLEKNSPCKVNLLLNILGKRPDGFHELETLMHPIRFYDVLSFKAMGKSGRQAIQLTCSDAGLPVDSGNLVYRAAEKFLQTAHIGEAVEIHLEKKIPMAAGLGGGSGNAATTLLGLNELFDNPVTHSQLNELAASLGSDIPFFLQEQPALATGRGENVISVESFDALKGMFFILIHPGFGISTPWAYQNLARFPEALNGKPGRAVELVSNLSKGDLKTAFGQFYNSLEAPALDKYPVLKLYQEHFMENGASATLMSGSGSTTFGLVRNKEMAANILESFKSRFGEAHWSAMVPVC